MAIAVVQRNKGLDAAGGTGSIAVAFGSNVTAGSCLIAIAVGTDGSQALWTSEFATPTDTRGNTWNLVLNKYTATYQIGVKVWAAYNTAAGADTITMNDTNNPGALYIYEASGLASSAAFDKSSFQAYVAGTGSFDSLSTPTTSFANELLLGIFGSGLSGTPTWTIGTNYVNLQQQNNTSGVSSAVEERIVSATGTYNATATSSVTTQGGLAVIVSFSDTPIPVPLVTKLYIRPLRPHAFSPGLAR